MKSHNLFRMALVIDTSHSRFLENLGNVIVYVIREEEELGNLVYKSKLPEIIEKWFTLEFTYDEIDLAIRAVPKYFQVLNDGLVTLTENGRKQIKLEARSAFENIIKNYISNNAVNRDVNYISDLIHKYIYNSLDTNIEALINVIKGDEKSSSLHVMDKWKNEDRKIVNDFIDWQNEEKDLFLYKIVAFAVDYCRLTVKKDGSNFKTILNGKKFYLDANIIFRLMGVNNPQRKNTTERFIYKCKEAKISLFYTSVTKQEVFGSIKHHVNIIKQMMQGYKGKGKSLYNLSKKSNYEDDFLKFFLEWSSMNNSYTKYDEFEQYLKRLFFECLMGIKEESTNILHISDDYLNSYIDCKDRYIRQENAEFDIQNVLFVQRSRNKKNSGTGWNISEYLISADHKLIDWSQKNINSANPIVVLPSVWYAIILKILGRTDEDEKAFSEFIKMRYVQTAPVDNLNYLINSVCNQAEDGILQDMLFDEICESNNKINKIGLVDEKEIDSIVKSSFDVILKKTREESFVSGRKEGNQKGYDDGLAKGEKIGRIKSEISLLKANKSKNALRKRRRNIIINIVFFVIAFFGVCICLYILPAEWLKAISAVVRVLLSLGLAGGCSSLIIQAFPVDIEKISAIENVEIESKIVELEKELELYD